MDIRPYKAKNKSKSDQWLLDYYNSKKEWRRIIFYGSRADAEALAAELCKQINR